MSSDSPLWLDNQRAAVEQSAAQLRAEQSIQVAIAACQTQNLPVLVKLATGTGVVTPHQLLALVLAGTDLQQPLAQLNLVPVPPLVLETLWSWAVLSSRLSQPETAGLPVVDSRGQLRGLVTATSLLRAKPALEPQVAEQNIALQAEILERQQVELALRRSRERLQLVLDTFPQRVFWKDRQFRYLGCNRQFAKDAGFDSPEDLVGRTDFELKWADLAPDFRAKDTWVMEQNQSKVLYEESQRHIDGQWQWLLTTKVPLRDESGQVIGLLGSYEDISARKQAEVEIRRALEREREWNTLKSQFISMVSHEFRTPLTSILSSTELLQRYGQQWPVEKCQHRYQRIIQAVDRMTHLLNDVLVIGKAEAGQLAANPQNMPLLALCQELVEDLQTQRQTTHQLTLEKMNHCPSHAWFDPQLLHHILSNLLTNAVKYSPQGGQVVLRIAYCPDNYPQSWVFQIEDDGIGIASAECDRIFELFHRGDNVGNIPGTGLGLAIVKQCVDLLHGQVSVDSRLGQGTLFTVVLPVIAPVVASAASPPS